MAQGKLTSVATVPGVSNPPAPASPVYDVPQGIFVNNQTATALLDGKLVELKNIMLQLQQGDPSFNSLLVKYRYFNSIKEHLSKGATTPNAIAAGLWIFLENVEMGSTPLATQQSLKNEAIDLLN